MTFRRLQLAGCLHVTGIVHSEIDGVVQSSSCSGICRNLIIQQIALYVSDLLYCVRSHLADSAMKETLRSLLDHSDTLCMSMQVDVSYHLLAGSLLSSGAP